MESINLSGLLVLKFYSDTCVPCKRLNPIIDKMGKEFPSIKIYNVDVEEGFKLAKQYRIMSVPTLVFLNGEQEIKRIEGMVNTESVRKSFKALAG